MISNPSAKTRFQQSSHLVDQHQKMVSDPIFQASIDFSLLEYQERLQFASTSGDLNNAAGSYLRLLGAREFVMILSNLGQKDVPPPARKDNINLITRPN